MKKYGNWSFFEHILKNWEPWDSNSSLGFLGNERITGKKLLILGQIKLKLGLLKDFLGWKKALMLKKSAFFDCWHGMFARLN